MPNPRRDEPQSLRVVVLASGNGGNLQAILDTFSSDESVEIVGVASNKADAWALERARKRRVPTEVFQRAKYRDSAKRDVAMATWIKGLRADLIVSAGYLAILSPSFVNEFRLQIINIHPSLLPQFRGLNAIQQAFDAGVRRSGVTVHFIDEGVDTGPVIKQRSVRKRRKDSLQVFEERIHQVEHQLLPEIIREIAIGKRKIGTKREARSAVTPEALSEAYRGSVAWIRAFSRQVVLVLTLRAGDSGQDHTHGPAPNAPPH
jgi:phosphoribosylglycinamide formyltransferase 1